jgi:hypothetical protein
MTSLNTRVACAAAISLGVSASLDAQCTAPFAIALDVPRINSERPFLADVDMDGTRDLLTVDGTGMLRYRRGTSAGFDAPISLTLPPYSNIKSIRDLDGNGAPDLLVSSTYGWNCGSNSVRIYWNLAGQAMPFGEAFTQLSLPASPYCIEADTMDFDGDGLHDVIITSMLNTVRLHRNAGGRLFSVQSNLAWPRDLYYRSTVDLDGDGKSDFMAMHKSGWADGQWGAYLYRGNGSGGFSPAIVDFASERTAFGFAFAPHGAGTTSVAIYAGSSIGQVLRVGRWSNATARLAYQSVNVPSPYQAFQGRDLTGDGKDDLVLQSGGTAAALAYMQNDGAGNFSAAPIQLLSAPGFEFHPIHAVIANGRRAVEVAATSATSLRVYRSACVSDACPADLDGDGTVGGVDLGIVLGAWGSAGGLFAADIDHDGSVDGNDLGMVLGGWGPCPD